MSIYLNKIFIICSKAFYKDIPPIKEKLEKNGWEVFLPHTYENPNAENEWYAKGKEEHAKMKGEMFRRSRDRIKSMDAILPILLASCKDWRRRGMVHERTPAPFPGAGYVGLRVVEE